MTYKNIYIDGILSDLTVTDGIISRIEAAQPESMEPVAQTLDCKALRWALPAFVNMHTHSSMTLFRSAGSGQPLQQWLHETIFPLEAKLTPDDVYRGALDAFEEMRNSGTTAFNDMYFNIESTLQAAIEKNMRGIVSLSVTDADFENPEKAEKTHQFFKDFDRLATCLPKGVTVAVAPHAIYSVSKKNLCYVTDFAREHNLPLHIHISETQAERENCLKEHGVPPVIYLDKLGILNKTGSRFIGAHALWLDESEIHILGEHHANVVHCPNSNLKLGSGFRFLYCELRDAGVNVTLGTDGCASSDNLDMVEAMKTMSLLQKGTRLDASVLPADEVFRIATENGYRALGMDDCGLRTGARANFFLVDISRPPFSILQHPELSPNQRNSLFLNQFIYAAHGNSITKTITA